MAAEILVPSLGESVSEATIAKWFKNKGDEVATDEILVELETDKVTLEVNAPASGILENITKEEGEVVEVGSLLGLINESEISAKPQAVANNNAKATAEAPAASAAKADSPAVRKLAAENNIDTSKIDFKLNINQN